MPDLISPYLQISGCLVQITSLQVYLIMQSSTNKKQDFKYNDLITPQELGLLNYKTIIQSNQFDYVYEPNDDTFLMLSTLKQEITHFQQNLFICQLGSGSGILSANIHNWLKNISKAPLIHLSIDINMDASLLSKKYYEFYGLNINQINGSLFNNFRFSSLGEHLKPDIIIFNPPYVAVEQEQLDNQQKYLSKKLQYVRTNKKSLREKQQNMIAFSYMGGLDGLLVTRKILSQITWNCIFYFIVMGWDGLQQITQEIKKETVFNKEIKYQNTLQIMQYSQFHNQDLFVLKLKVTIM